mmetsp:Transcript_11482/g.33101  ORF Transcript_11482/g.33101 Transcript_11482/m.33101 type:complete len:328 (+) Transcript_11482:557-1540(+)
MSAEAGRHRPEPRHLLADMLRRPGARRRRPGPSARRSEGLAVAIRGRGAAVGGRAAQPRRPPYLPVRRRGRALGRGRRGCARGGLHAAEQVRHRGGLHDRRSAGSGGAGHLCGVSWRICFWERLWPWRWTRRALDDLHARDHRLDLLLVAALAVSTVAAAFLDFWGADVVRRLGWDGALQRQARGVAGRASHERLGRSGACRYDLQHEQLAALCRLHEREPGLLLVAQPLGRDTNGAAEQIGLPARCEPRIAACLRQAGPRLEPLRRPYLLQRARAAAHEGARDVCGKRPVARRLVVGGLAARLFGLMDWASDRRANVGRRPDAPQT